MKRNLIQTTFVSVLMAGMGSALADTSLGFGASYQFLTGNNNVNNTGLFVQFDQSGLLVGSRLEAGIQQGNNPGFNLKAAVMAELPAALGLTLKFGAGPEVLRDTRNNSWAVSGYVFASPEFDLALGLSAFAELSYSKVLYAQVPTPDAFGVKAGVRFTF
ncbi:hypothetical protein [Deinococcus cellulosilyticus]|uniref:Outer membrane protein beta-barrel domain-containing protein n=1 Tax=Deinococcus cellulosilyticus (strain DSM 18568 / NBRC 106333 / KACC 11606 / 5516J-15) TaxID=1223518 RepID=A0A511N608_DEIC1|nr:hypothetical protein [Deinococcus cellulosilyticus]GEM48299.1 hypothetical protein DC3_39340 [Deinococcus cellulosilyticus NBRC 106333 = KACC 11606]